MRIKLQKPHSAQAKVIREAKRFNVVICGRRWGKTELGIDRAVDTMLLGYPVAWLAPTYKSLSEVWRKMCRLLAPIAETIDKQEKRIVLITGGSVDFWSLDNPDAPRGRKYKRIIWDEAALHRNPDTFPSVVRPLLTDYRGDLWLLTTPRGKDWIWVCYERGQVESDPAWKSWKLPTITNPFIHPAEILDAEQLLPRRFFEQEYLAEFIEDGSGVFRGIEKVCVGTPEPEPVPGYRYTMGVDWGKVNDFTVISIFKWLPFARDEKPRQVYLDRFNKIDWTFQRARLLTLAQKWQVRGILAEENSIGSPVLSELKKEHITGVTIREDEDYTGQPIEERTEQYSKLLPIQGFYTSPQSKPLLIESYALAIEREEIILLNDPTQKAELSAYEIELMPSGRFRYSAPAGMHDDTVIAGALTFQTIQRRGFVTSAPNPFYS
jgi:hypothetical protein